MKDKVKETNLKAASYLREIRLEEDLTMRSLARRIGLPHSFIGKIEQQGRRIDIGEFIHYCQAMNRDPVVVLQQLIDL